MKSQKKTLAVPIDNIFVRKDTLKLACSDNDVIRKDYVITTGDYLGQHDDHCSDPHARVEWLETAEQQTPEGDRQLFHDERWSNLNCSSKLVFKTRKSLIIVGAM